MESAAKRSHSDSCNFRQNFAKYNVDLYRILLEIGEYFAIEVKAIGAGSVRNGSTKLEFLSSKEFGLG